MYFLTIYSSYSVICIEKAPTAISRCLSLIILFPLNFRLFLRAFYFNRTYFVALPIPSLLISPSAINFLNAPSIELALNDGQSSLISCLVNLPSFCKIAFVTISTAGSFSSIIKIYLQTPYM